MKRKREGATLLMCSVQAILTANSKASDKDTWDTPDKSHNGRYDRRPRLAASVSCKSCGWVDGWIQCRWKPMGRDSTTTKEERASKQHEPRLWRFLSTTYRPLSAVIRGRRRRYRGLDRGCIQLAPGPSGDMSLSLTERESGMVGQALRPLRQALRSI